MDAFRTAKMLSREDVHFLLLELHKMGYYAHIAAQLKEEVTNQLLYMTADSKEFQTAATDKMALVKWFIQIDTEAATELERMASENQKGQ